MVLRGARVTVTSWGMSEGEGFKMLPKGTKLTDHVALAVGDLMGTPKHSVKP